MAQVGLYRGFSSYQFQKNRSFALTDIDLVKSDLLNHIFTKKGERVRMPTFGTDIYKLIFEPLDDLLLDLIYDEFKTVFDYDPRVEIVSLNVVPDYDNNTVTASAILFYVELNLTDNFIINLDLES